MRKLFYFYLIGQLIALPFAIGAIGDLFGGSNADADTAPDPLVAESSFGSLYDAYADLDCGAIETLSGSRFQDEIDQLQYITRELYGDGDQPACNSSGTHPLAPR